MPQLPTRLEELEESGCTFVRGVIDAAGLRAASLEIDSLLNSSLPGVLKSRDVGYGVRNLLEHWPASVDLIQQSPALVDLIGALMGSGAGVVRGLLFDKPPERSWTLPWHRDRTIAVEKTQATLPDGFRSPTKKAGILHLNAPNDFLARMLTLRFSIDPMTSQNGQLSIMSGSHNTRLSDDTDLEMSRAEPLDESDSTRSTTANTQGVRSIECDAGDVFVMRPLLAHCSSKSDAKTTLRRRVIHLELAPQALLPAPLKWHCFIPIKTKPSC